MVRARGPLLLFLALLALAAAFAVFLSSDREANGATFQWGDFDCNGGVTIGDAQKVARDLIGLPITQGPGCPTPGESVNVDGVFRFWGDIDCSEPMTIGDAQKLARKLIGLPVAVAPDCPDAEEDVSIDTATATPTATSTRTPTATPTHTATSSPTRTATPTQTLATTPAATPTAAPTATSTPTVSATPTPTPTATPTPSPSPAPTPSYTPPQNSTFGDGTWIVGTQVPAGLWRNSDSSHSCYWERLSGFGGSLGEIIANEFSDTIQTVEIKPTDQGFTSQRCGTWSRTLTPPSSGPIQPFGPGTWLVGEEIAPGLWRNSDSSQSCYWARLSGFGGELSDIIANEFSSTIQTVEIKPTDQGFTSQRCGTWSRTLTPPSSGPMQPFGPGTWLVGEEIAPGLWRNSDSSQSCYWARLSGFGGELSDIIANEFSTTIQTVQISSSDAGFLSQRCGTWTRIGS